MKFSPLIQFCRDRPLFVVLLAAIMMALVKAVVDGIKMEEGFSNRGNDDIMRLVMVRDWLAGQGWFDTTQYRLIPPEGVLIHWSRYIDAGIAAFILPFSYVMPMQQAELIGAAIWPTIIFILILLVIGLGTKRLFGPVAACFAVLCTIFWPLLADLHARAGDLDHHNIQLLMMLILVYAVVWPTRPVAAGITGGLAAAFSLSTGLESLLFIIAASALVYGRNLLSPGAGTRRLLVAYCLALAGGSVLFWFGITAPELRGLPVCDQLGTPMFSLIAIAVVASLAPLALRGRMSGPAVQFGVTLGVTAIGFALAWPLLGPCLRGPYGDLPPELQEMISTRVVEAKPLFLYAQTQLSTALTFTIPVVTALVAGVVLWVSQRQQDEAGQSQRVILGQLLLLGLVGVGMTFLQMRTVIMAATVVPAIGGLCLAVLLNAYLSTRDIAKAALLFIVAIGVIAPQLLLQPLWPYIKGENSEASADADAPDCRQYASLTALNAVPPAVILNHTNMGAPILWATHHSTLAAPYHRSPAAFMNGALGFDLEENGFEALAREAGATHVLLCADNRYHSEFLTALAAQETTADWLRRVPVGNDDQMLFAVLD